MEGEWRTTTVGDVALRVTKGTTPTTIGGGFVERGISFVKVESLTDDGRIDKSKLAYVDEATNTLLSRSVLARDDILFTIAGTIGRVALVPDEILPANTNQAVAIVRPNRDAVLPRFLYYVLGDDNRVRHAQTRVVQSVQANFSLSELGSLEIPLPPLAEQQAIARMLGTLDDKIELNRRMSETLEATARALFKSWFVDFDPVRARADGRDAGLPKHIADLFPARLVASELGEIPEGWEVKPLENVLTELEVGGRPKGGVSSFTEGVPSIGAESIVGLGRFDYSKTKYVPGEFFHSMRKGHVKDGDVLLYKDGGRPGEFEPHVTLAGNGFPFRVCAINEHVYRLRADAVLDQNFLFFWLSSDRVMEEMRIKGTGVAIPGLNSTQVKSLTTLIPSREIIRTFESAAAPLVCRVLANCNEARTLAILRDSLLPKLISGEIRLKGGAIRGGG